jgi:hypothetical protein
MIFFVLRTLLMDSSMRMTFAQFTKLAEHEQLAVVCATGAFVAARQQEVYEAVDLYQLPGGFFVELTYDAETNEVQYLRAFEASATGSLPGTYSALTPLPNGLSGAE